VHARPSVISDVERVLPETGQLIGQQRSRLQDDHSHWPLVSHSTSRRTDLTSWFPCHDYCCWQNDVQLIIIICCRLS